MKTTEQKTLFAFDCGATNWRLYRSQYQVDDFEVQILGEPSPSPLTSFVDRRLPAVLLLSPDGTQLESYGENAQSHQKILQEYSHYLLDQMISVVTASTLMAYALYTMAPETIQKFGTKYMILTIPFVIYGIFRYLYLVHQKEQGGNPTTILITDKPILFNVVLWVLMSVLIIYV